MPVRADTIRRTLKDGTQVEHKKPVYFCACGAFASFGKTSADGKRRDWFCGWRDGEPVCINRGKL